MVHSKTVRIVDLVQYSNNVASRNSKGKCLYSIILQVDREIQ